MTPIDPSRRRLIGKLLLVAGILLIVSFGMPEVPRSQTLVLDLRSHHELESVAVALTRLGQTEAARGFRLPLRTTRQRITHVVELPHGRYDARVSLRDRKGGETHLSRRVTLDGDAVTLRLSIDP